MIPDDTKDEIEEAVDRGVRMLDAYEQRFKERFGASTGVAIAIDVFTYVTALYVFYRFSGIHVAFQIVALFVATVAAIGVVKKIMKVVGKTTGNL